MSKKFLLRADEILEIAPGLGACYASDHITVEGQKVGFMYREEPDNDVDSGEPPRDPWRPVGLSQTAAV
jgi:hypothetical protein